VAVETSLVGIAAVNEAASEIRKRIPEYRYKVVGDIRTMHNVGMCRWGSGLPDQPFRYTGTDVLEERNGRVAVFCTFIDSGTPPISATDRVSKKHSEAGPGNVIKRREVLCITGCGALCG
jgi:hypothetical protein